MPDPHQSDHDLLIRLDENVKELIRRFDAFLRTQGDHETRLKMLEEWKANIMGRFAVIAVLASLIGSAVVKLVFDKLNIG